MKTIADLNERWWYRLTKVLYATLFLIIIGSWCIGMFLAYEPNYDNSKSYIECANRERFNLSENGMTLYSSWMSTEDKKRAWKLCGGETETLKRNADGIITLTKEEFDLRYKEPEPSFWDGIEKVDSPQYRLVSVYTERDWIAITGSSILGILVALLTFEALRRIFYYIVLGSLRPKKI